MDGTKLHIDRHRLLLKEVAEHLRTSLRQVRNWVADGELRAIDVSSKPGSLGRATSSIQRT